MHESILSDKIKGRILLVDDQTITLKVITRFLSEEGFELVSATNGIDAMNIFEKNSDFDLLILDIMMPKMNGYEVCRKVRDRFSLFEMPVLFLTAKAGLGDMVEGFEAGANDFLRKPFEKDELIIRSKTLIKLKKLTNANKVLEEAVRLKNRFMEMSIHDLKNPLTSIIVMTDMLKQEESIKRENRDMLDIVSNSSAMMLKLVEDLLQSARIESGKVTLLKEHIDFVNAVSEVIIDNEQKAILKEQKINFHFDTHTSYIVHADRIKLRQIIENLVSNAIKYSPYRSIIDISLEKSKKKILFCVKDYGQGLSEGDLENVFSRFNKLSAVPTGGESSSGIGLSIAKDLVGIHNGKIWVESELDKGSSFFVEFAEA